MKSRFILLLVLIISALSLRAQLEVTPTYGYYWGGRVNFYEGEFRMHDGQDFGLTVGVPTVKGNTIELAWSYNNSTAEFFPYTSFGNEYKYSTGGFTTNYFLLGSVQQFETGGKIEPFIGLSIGTSIYNYKNYSNVWRFAAGLSGGMKIYINDKIGIRLQGRMLMPMYFAGLGFYAGIGTGGVSSGLSLNTGALAIQGDVSAGLIFRLK